MDLHNQCVMFLALAFSPTGALGLELNDPKLCYILDAFLLLYSITITALFFKTKFSKLKDNNKDNIYMGLNKPGDTYDELRPGNDPENGRGNVAAAADSVYTPLKRETEDTYKQIATKKERRRKNEQVYQDLNTRPKESAYEALQMQPMLPPR